MIVNVIFWRRTDAPPQWGPRSYLPSKSDEDEVVVLVLPPYLPTYSSLKHALRLTAAGLRTCETGATLAPLFFSKRSDRRAGCRRPSDRRERCVNPLLYDAVAGVGRGPATDGRAANRSLKKSPPNGLSGGDFFISKTVSAYQAVCALRSMDSGF